VFVGPLFRTRYSYINKLRPPEVTYVNIRRTDVPRALFTRKFLVCSCYEVTNVGEGRNGYVRRRVRRVLVVKNRRNWKTRGRRSGANFSKLNSNPKVSRARSSSAPPHSPLSWRERAHIYVDTSSEKVRKKIGTRLKYLLIEYSAAVTEIFIVVTYTDSSAAPSDVHTPTNFDVTFYRYRRGEHFSPFVLNGAVQDSYRAVEIVKQAAPRVLPTAHSGAAGVTRERRPRPNIRTRPIGKSRNRGAGLETHVHRAPLVIFRP